MRDSGWKPFLAHQARLYNFEPTGTPFMVGAALGGWGSAKSTSIARKLVKFVHANPWTSVYGSLNPISVVTAPTAAILRSATKRAIKRQIPPGLVIRERGTPHNDWLWVNGHLTLFWSVEAELEGLDICAWVADEVHHPNYQKDDRWMNYWARVRDPDSRSHAVLVAGLPEMGFIRDKFDIPAGSPRHASEITVLSGMRENFYLPAATVEKYRQNCPAGQEQYFLEGRWRMAENAIYSKFDSNVHVVELWLVPDEVTHLGWDFGDRGHVILGQKPGKVLQIGAEIHSEGLDAPGQVARVQALQRAQKLFIGRRGSEVSRICVDPTAKAEQIKPLKDAWPDARIVQAQRGDSYFEVDDGIRCCQRALMDSTGVSRVRFARSLLGARFGIIDGVQTYRRNERTMMPVKDNSRDHALDGWRYLVCELLPEDRPGWRVIR